MGPNGWGEPDNDSRLVRVILAAPAGALVITFSASSRIVALFWRVFRTSFLRLDSSVNCIVPLLFGGAAPAPSDIKLILLLYSSCFSFIVDLRLSSGASNAFFFWLSIEPLRELFIGLPANFAKGSSAEPSLCSADEANDEVRCTLLFSSKYGLEDDMPCRYIRSGATSGTATAGPDPVDTTLCRLADGLRAVSAESSAGEFGSSETLLAPRGSTTTDVFLPLNVGGIIDGRLGSNCLALVTVIAELVCIPDRRECALYSDSAIIPAKL
eukprot:GDKJ01027078.1.p2 GENE.GDKJ01027078.1~~GDKJ01027078.1.p2  ORF type:complete len:269 (+),score=-4.31 GDKJ01027078.1:968-1774(+)